MKILLSSAYFLRLDPKQFRAQTPYPPLATLYAAAVLRKAGYEVQVFDTQFCQSGNDIESHLKKFQPDIFVIYDDSFNYLSKMCLSNMRSEAFRMQQLAKGTGCKIIASSSDASDHFEEYLQQGADFVISGEAENTLLEIAHALENNTDPNIIQGLIFKNGSVIKKTVARPVLKDLDLLPFPAWDLIDLEPYKRTWKKKHGYFSVNLVTTRGCPFKCNWCAKPIYGNRYNSHSPYYVVSMIEELQKQSSFDHIWFADDIFGLKPGWLKEFASLIREKNLKISYKIQSRADLLTEDNAVNYLSSSGCETVWMGAESGSQKILDAMDKGIHVEQIYEAVHLLRKNKIKPSLFLQFGYPGETKDDIQLTLKMIRDLLPEDIGISVSYPLPGTVFYERVKEELKQKANWTHSDDLDLMFKNKFSSTFYKRLHRYVHRSYRGYQSLNNFKKLISFRETPNMKRAIGFPFYYAAAWAEKFRLNKLDTTIL
jgi:radical SAM superfamily enzyme YgiQ (UPF0313 family)